MKRNSQKQMNKAYHKRIKGMLKGESESEIFASLSAGKNTYLRYDRLQSSSFDSSWIEMIEGVIFDLGEIIANPRMNTKAEGNIVPVELARKTGAESVQHLASHTQYVKEIDEYGNVIPSKIMTMVSEDDLHTYENRFIATLVRRLVLFIEKRYEVVSEFAELRNQEVLMFKNKSIVNGAEVEIETKVKIAYKSDDKEALKSSAYIERIRQIRDYVLYFYNSSFMKKLKTERDVRNPILQTNIIRKNPKYHHCYEVYRFIETYDKIGVNYKVDENYSLFDDSELEELNHTLFANYITLKGKDISKNHKQITHIYKPRILTSYDDEQFIYGDLLKGPISFVRVDERYQEYLDSKVKKDLPLHPTKREKEYYADEYEQKRENREDLKEKNDLLRRKNKEINQFEKKVDKILQERELARQNLENMEKEIIKKEENDRLTAARNAIINASINDQEDANKDYLAKQEEKELNELKKRIAETKVVEPTHPYSDPVTYDEAVEQIWPHTKDVSIYREEKEEVVAEEVIEEEIIQEDEKQEVVEKPITVVEMSHPYQEPVTYDEAVEQIWPQSKGVSLLRIRSKEEMVEEERKADAVINEPVKPAKVKKVKEKKVIKTVKVIEPSHPYQEPVTYDEAVEQIWPQTKNVSIYRQDIEEEVVEEIVVEEEITQEEINEPIEVIEMSHPYQEPVTYDEAVEQIWPNVKDAPLLRVAPKEEVAPAKKAPVVRKKRVVKKAAPKKVAKPVPAPIKVIEPSHPYQEPVTYDEAVEQIWPNVKDAPLLRVAPQEEPVVIEKPVVKKKAAPKKKPATKKAKKAPAKKAKPVEEFPVEETPIVEEAPVVKEEPVIEPEPVIETPIVEEPPVEEAPIKEAPIKKAKKPAKKAAAKKKPVKKPVKKEEKPREKIPGKFIVKTNKGYYVNKGKYSVYKDDAKIFDDFNLAKDIKDAKGGKIVKL